MCLDYIDESIKVNKFKIGYKVFICLDNNIFPCSTDIRKSLPINKLLNEVNYRAKKFLSFTLDPYLHCMYTMQKYRYGFHIFLSKRDAYNFKRDKSISPLLKVYKVKFSCILAKGREDGCEVVVCREMKILRCVKSR